MDIQRFGKSVGGKRAMDIRIEKTKRSIKNAFIELRSRKSLERITVKEVCEKAEINKSTFYSHYQDIYDLSDKLETEVVESIIGSLNHPENLLKNPEEFTKELYLGYAAKNALICILFSRQPQRHPCAEAGKTLKELIFSVCPEYREDPKENVKLTYNIYGGYYAYFENREYGDELVISTIGRLSGNMDI